MIMKKSTLIRMFLFPRTLSPVRGFKKKLSITIAVGWMLVFGFINVEQLIASPMDIFGFEDVVDGPVIEQENENNPGEISVFVLKWISAWQNSAGENGDIEKYVSFYADSFTSKNFDKSGWEIDKRKKNNNKSWITVDLRNILIGDPNAEGRVEVRFLQDYKSSNYSEQSQKLLVLTQERGKWKILTEKTLSSE